MTYAEIQEVQRSTDVNYSPYYDELPRLINEHGYKVGIEVGIFAGGNSKSILDKTNVTLLIGVDPYLEYKPDQIGMGTINTQDEFNIMCELAIKRLDHKRFVHVRETSDDAIHTIKRSILGNEQVDFIFLDGSHTAEQLQRDFDNYAPLVRKGGVISAHDYVHPTFPELTDVINNFARNNSAQLVIGPLHFVHLIKTW